MRPRTGAACCGLLLSFLCACESVVPSAAHVPSPQPPVCADAPRHHGGLPAGVQPSLGPIPWVAGDPPAAGILGFMFFGDQVIKAHGIVPDGRSAKILWLVDYVKADLTTGQTLVLEAKRLSGPGSVRKVLSRAGINSDRLFDPSHPDPSIPA